MVQRNSSIDFTDNQTSPAIPVPMEKPDIKKEGQIPKEQGPWDWTNRGPNGGKSEPLSESDAQNLLWEFTDKPFRSILETREYYDNRPSDNYQFKDIDEMLGHTIGEHYKCYQSYKSTLPFKAPTIYYDENYLHRVLATKEFIPFTAIANDIWEDLQVFRKTFWPDISHLGLRPWGQLAFLHSQSEKILVFISIRDDALYLWSKVWDEHLSGEKTLIRGARTLAEIEVGILAGKHVIRFEEGGWLKFAPLPEPPRQEEEDEWEEDLYGWDPPKRKECQMQPETHSAAQLNPVLHQMAAAQM